MKHFGPGDTETYPCWVQDPTNEPDAQQEIEFRAGEIFEEMLGYSGPGFAMFRDAIEEASRSNDDVDFLSALQSLVRDRNSDRDRVFALTTIMVEYCMEALEAYTIRKAEEGL